MKRIKAIILTTILTLTLFSGCGITSWQKTVAENAAANKYTLLFIDDGNSPNAPAIKSSMIEYAKKLSDQFVFVEVDYKKEEANILKYINASSISEFPLTLSIAPSGLISGGFTKPCTEDELKATIVSEKEGAIMLSLQKGLVTLLCIYNGQSENFIDVSRSLASVETNFGGVVKAHYLDTTNETDKAFVDNLPERKGDITVMIIVPPGSIVATLSDSEITLSNLLSTIQSSCGSGGCGPSGCG